MIFSTSGEVRKCRSFYKITKGGEFEYSLLFSNIIDSTYAEGSISYKNLICKSWEIHSMQVGRCKKDTFLGVEIGEDCVIPNLEIEDKRKVTFAGKESKTVSPGEFFTTDVMRIFFEKGDYLCVEMEISGEMIPYHEESLLPIFMLENGEWKYCRKAPLAGMVGCGREVKKRIAFFGDSITQGIGTAVNSYEHWNAVLSEKLGEDYGYWNIGIGYGRANDAATDGAWLFKAKQNDIVFVCFGVNDILQNMPEDQIKNDLFTIVSLLKKEGIKVILQTVPPFDYAGENVEIWHRINAYIKNELSVIADFVFDNNPFLGESTECPQKAKFGGHPNSEGCRIWAEELFKSVGDIILQEAEKNKKFY